jgi:hypothetical protein
MEKIQAQQTGGAEVPSAGRVGEGKDSLSWAVVRLSGKSGNTYWEDKNQSRRAAGLREAGLEWGLHQEAAAVRGD